MKALDILMNDRKKLVEEIIKKMEKQGLEWKKGWTPEMLLPKNPSSDVTYKGRNVLKTFHASLINEYNDPRWVTFNLMGKKSPTSIGGAMNCLIFF